MKYITSLFSLFIFSSVHAQDYSWYDINFEDTNQLFRLSVDTVSNPENIWQIGPPRKKVFTGAYSEPNAIVTDTGNFYPPADTSSFIIEHLAQDGYTVFHTAIISGKYKVNSDSLNDFGTIEFSPDNGKTWFDLLADTFYYEEYCGESCVDWWTDKPVLTGNSNGWIDFAVNLAYFGMVFDFQPGDTVLYKFTFISDENPDTLDGLMFDDLHFEDWWEGGINEMSYEHIDSRVYPNPAENTIIIEYKNTELYLFQLIIYNNSGRQILAIENLESDHIEIDINNFTPGFYYYKLINCKYRKITSGRFIMD